MIDDRRRRGDRWSGVVLAGSVALLTASVVLPFGGPEIAAQDTDFARPQRHFRVERPASLDANAARVVYNRILDDMVAGYALSRHPTIPAYRAWRRFNRAPYRSATHGDRFVNNYANEVAEDLYGALGDADELPVGSVVAKDSFAVTAAGDVYTGPLFLMEKMPSGFNANSRDWRYSMILPDGSFFGDTGGDNSERVEFCVTCHETAGDENDHLFFVPEGNRAKVYRLDEITE